MEEVREFIAGVDINSPSITGAVIIAVIVYMLGTDKRPFVRFGAAALAASGFWVSVTVGVATTGVAFAMKGWHARKSKAAKRRLVVAATLIPWLIYIPLVAWAHPENTEELGQYVLPGAAGIVFLALVVFFIKRREPERDPVRTATNEMKSKVKSRDKNRCRYCGANGDALGVELQYDHVHPWSKGGRTSVENLQLLCVKCNRMKSDMSDAHARRKYKQVNRSRPVSPPLLPKRFGMF